MTNLPFTKMHGIGNDFVMVDAIRNPVRGIDETELARRVNDRRFGIGGDGLVFLERGDSAPFRMRMLNPDGSESEMCGNAVRCLAVLLRDHGYTDEDKLRVETGAGLLELEILGRDLVRVNMGKARLQQGEIGMNGVAEERFIDVPILSSAGELPATAVSMGNPHLVLFTPAADAIDLPLSGAELEHDSRFPQRTNVHFVQVIDRHTLLQRTWERGAGATLACGTGACASAVAAYETGRADRSVGVRLPGGTLEIEYLEDGTVYMTGPTATVFTGELAL